MGNSAKSHLSRLEPVNIGTKFHYHYKDSNPEWEVTKARGATAWECTVTAESLDWSGSRKVFGTEEIRSAIATLNMWNEIASDHDKWWAARKTGETVHYRNGFGQFVRGRIVFVVTDEYPNGRNVMLPTALVGKWQAHDLPHYDAAGNLREGHFAKKINETGETMQPNYSNMVEVVGVRDNDTDPRGQPALDITRPQRNAEQVEAARLEAIKRHVLAALNDVRHVPDQPYSETLRNALKLARNVLDSRTG